MFGSLFNNPPQDPQGKDDSEKREKSEKESIEESYTRKGEEIAKELFGGDFFKNERARIMNQRNNAQIIAVSIRDYIKKNSNMGSGKVIGYDDVS
jgi:hypothetical protein